MSLEEVWLEHSGALEGRCAGKTLVRWSTDDGHKVYFSEEEDRHEYGVGFLVHKDVVNAVLGCRPVSSRLISISLRAAPFNITIIQIYAPTSGHDDSEVDHFYQQLQENVGQTPKKNILVVQGDWNAKVENVLIFFLCLVFSSQNL